jgi:hypothetical protein
VGAGRLNGLERIGEAAVDQIAHLVNLGIGRG